MCVRYPHSLTVLGYASTFVIDPLGEQDNKGELNRSKINLRDKRHEKDVSPLVLSCSCFTCKNHTRAYIHHLLNVHEMLAETLLAMPPIHHYLQFFKQIRHHIETKSFDLYKQAFLTAFHQ